MRLLLHPVPISCMLIAIAGVVLGQLPVSLLGILCTIASVGFLAARHAQETRSEDVTADLPPESRILLKPVARLADEIESLVQQNGGSQTIAVIGGESLEGAKQLLTQTAQLLSTREELRKILKGRWSAEKDVQQLRDRLQNASDAEKRSLQVTLDARTLELSHYGEVAKNMGQIDAFTKQAEAALAEMKARLSATVSSEKIATVDEDGLRESLGRVTAISHSYEEIEDLLKH